MKSMTGIGTGPYAEPSPENLSLVRQGAEIQQMKPYMDAEISSMQKAVVSFVLSAVNSGTLTSDIAMSKWVEYIAYQKLSQKLSQKIEIGKSASDKTNLDF